MPRERDLGTRGDLYIRWEVDFPQDGWLSGREEAQRNLSSVLPPPRGDIASVEEETEVTIGSLTEAKIESFGNNQPRAPQGQEDFWEDETEAPQAGCAGS